MEQVRLVLAIVLSFLVLLLWNFFVVDKQPQPPVKQQPAKKTVEKKSEPVTTRAQDKKQVKPVAKKEEAVKAETEKPAAVPIDSRPAKIISVETPLYIVKISEKGAVFKEFILKKYKETVDENSPFKGLIPKDLPDGTLQAGFEAGKEFADFSKIVFSSDPEKQDIKVEDTSQKISFFWTSPQGIVFEKRFTFSPDTYLIKLDILVKNTSDIPVKGDLWMTLKSKAPEKAARYGFEGPSGMIDDSVEQIAIKKIEKKDLYKGKIRWIALETRYFIGSIIPNPPSAAKMKLALTAGHFLENKYILPDISLEPTNMKTLSFDIYFGPKSLKVLKGFNNGLDKVVNFGMFDFIAKPCLWLMNIIYEVIPNYGIAIIILTIITKVLLWPLGNKSYKSMNEMKRIQPLMAEIKEKYKDDKKKMNEEMMNLYKIYKVNPMGGCLPMVLQIPVFFALYRMLYEAIELRHAPFFGWINDLSAPDRLFHLNMSIPFMEPPYGIPVLTIIMGVTMIVQQRMSPPPGDPTQAKMMMFMPIIFTVIFINFSSGLVLYWLVNNILSIAQQYYIGKKNA